MTTKENLDGWANVLTNLGNQKDAVQRTKFNNLGRLQEEVLEGLYRTDGLARRIIDIPVDDSLRSWIKADDTLLKEHKRINLKGTLIDAAKWSRLYGGAIIVLFVDDGKEFHEPLNKDGIRQVLQLRVYEKKKLSFVGTDVDTDPFSTNFGLPEFLTVFPDYGTSFKVHHTRFFRFDGLSLPSDERQRNNGWGESVLHPIYESLKSYGITMQSSANIVRDFVQVVIGIKGLTEMLRQGQDDLIARRASIIDLTRSVSNTIFTDADGETYSKQASSVAGLGDLWDRFSQQICAVTGIPVTKLFGQSPGGFNSTGESDIRQYYDTVDAYRRDDLEPFINWINDILMCQRNTKEKIKDLAWNWPPLWQPTESEQADLKLKLAQSDLIYIDRNAVDAEYLFHLRYGQDSYRTDIHYNYEDYLNWISEREGNKPE